MEVNKLKNYEITVNEKTYQVSVKEVESLAQPQQVESKNAPVQNNSGASAGSETITAPMPGVILSVPVKEGQAISKGDTLCILEAMKMENEIVAPKSGTIGTISVRSNQAVDVGEVLLTIS